MLSNTSQQITIYFHRIYVYFAITTPATFESWITNTVLVASGFICHPTITGVVITAKAISGATQSIKEVALLTAVISAPEIGPKDLIIQ